MAKSKKKRRRRVSRYKGIKLSSAPGMPAETPEKLRKEFPEKLINVFVKVVASNWAEKPYKKYVKQAKLFLGKEKYEDRIESGKLIVNLSRACCDLTDEFKNKKVPKKIICEEHPKYGAMRAPRSGCKKCWVIYNGKKTSKKKKKAKKEAKEPS